MTEQVIVITDNGDAQSFYLQEIVNIAKQITDASVLKRIYLLARRLLGKQSEQHIEPKSWLVKACALMAKLPSKDQEGIYWLIERQVTCGVGVAKPSHKADSAIGTLKVMISEGKEDSAKP